MTFEDHEARKEKIRNELYARVKTSLQPRYVDYDEDAEDREVAHYKLVAKTRILGSQVIPTFALSYQLSLKEYEDALADLSILEGYKERLVSALYRAIDSYCAELGEEDDKVLS